jgi:selenocysteine lyase/cysteine desulfurase
LEAANIQAAQRAGGVRVGFHLYNDEEDADLAVDVLTSPEGSGYGFRLPGTRP